MGPGLYIYYGIYYRFRKGIYYDRVIRQEEVLRRKSEKEVQDNV